MPDLANADLVSDPGRAGARAHLRAMGLGEKDWARPLIGIATTWTGTMPCNLGQRRLAAHVAEGIRAAGGTPLEFGTIAVSDNLTQGTLGMRASLVSREVIADSIELVGRSQPFDGLICLAACDKTVPGALMALVRLDVPGFLFYSGAAAAGSYRGRQVTIKEVWEAVGRVRGRSHLARGARRARTRGVSRDRRLCGTVHGEHDGRRRSTSSVSRRRAPADCWRTIRRRPLRRRRRAGS